MTENQKQNRYGKEAGTDSFKGKDKRTDTKKKAEPDFNSKQTRWADACRTQNEKIQMPGLQKMRRLHHDRHRL